MPDKHQFAVRKLALKTILGLLALIACAALAPAIVFAQDTEQAAKPSAPGKTNPLAGNPDTIREGAALFRLSCGFCHGLKGHGGVRGPDLISGRLHDRTDETIFQTILQGIAGTQMPENDLTDDETWQVISYLRAAEVNPKPVEGNVRHGEDIFFGDGNCSTCHMVNGRGGRTGPDLSRVGATRPAAYIVESIRDPDRRLSERPVEFIGDVPRRFEEVVVTQPGGKKIQGVVLNEDNFTIQLIDLNERIYSLQKRDLREVVHTGKSVMPAYKEDVLGSQDLQDLVAYLSSLRRKQP